MNLRRFAENPCSRMLLPLATLLLTVAATAQIRWESTERDKWQRPNDVMDALGLKPGSAVADVGAGNGYFTRHFAHRVGPEGIVYAVDIRKDRLDDLKEKSSEERLSQIRVILGKTDDPSLPAESVDAILVMNSYHEFREYDAMMAGMFKALRPGGLLAIIDSPTEVSDSRNAYYESHDIPRQVVKEDAARAGFRFQGEKPGFTREGRWRSEFYFLIFQKPST